MSNHWEEYGPVRERPTMAKALCAKTLKDAPTIAERLLWSVLRARRLGGFHFRRQCVIRGFIADFYCHEARLVIEVDGPIHDTNIDYDTERDRIMEALGLRVIRFRNYDIQDRLDLVAQTILNACQS
ncbi:MAG: endonuclease domain-containing protein [Capsulimonadaceae bacterium]|nr:endonuclease domain-containing protein [Capsulimonadaceae bacterium]